MKTAQMTPAAVHRTYLTDDDIARIPHLRSFQDIGKMSVAAVDRSGGGLCMASGPMTTGGFRTPTSSIDQPKNMDAFRAMTESLAAGGHKVFSILPFEEVIPVLLRKWRERHRPGEYCYDLMEGIYRPLFQSGMITTMHFMPDFGTSEGARWEHSMCPHYGIRRVYCTQDDVDAAIRRFPKQVPRTAARSIGIPGVQVYARA